jgi:hypothetical protein
VGGHLLKPYVAEDELLWLNGERHGARASADPSRTADRVTLEPLTLTFTCRRCCRCRG